MSFTSIPLRANGQKFLYSWFNGIRSAGVLIEGFLGTTFLSETLFAIANNQASVANVTGLVFDNTVVKTAHIYAEVRRQTSSVEVISSGRLIAIYRNLTSTWELLDELSMDDDGVDFTITSAGQIQYVSDNQSGSGYAGTIRFKALTFSI